MGPETEPRAGQSPHLWGPFLVPEFIRQRERSGWGPSQSEHSNEGWASSSTEILGRVIFGPSACLAPLT